MSSGSPSSEPPVGGRILLVEDDGATRFALSRILTYAGYEVSTAATLAAALLKCDDHSCVLLDLHLPDGLGLDVLKRVRSRCPTAKVAICTAAYDPALGARVERHRPDATFIKPIDLDALLAWVKKACATTAAQGRRADADAREPSVNPHPPALPPELL